MFGVMEVSWSRVFEVSESITESGSKVKQPWKDVERVEAKKHKTTEKWSPQQKMAKQYCPKEIRAFQNDGSDQISSRPHTTDFPLKGSFLEGTSPYFREIQIGEIL